MKRKRDFNDKSKNEGLVKKLSVLTGHRDQTYRQLQNGKQSSRLDKDLDQTLQSIDNIETDLKTQTINRPLTLNPQPVEQKSKTPSLLPPTVKWPKLPLVMWVSAAGFLSKKEVGRLTSVNSLFVFVYMSYTKIMYRQLFPESETPHSYPSIHYLTQLRVFNEKIKEYDSYYNLIDESYRPLFQALKVYDTDTAIKFVSTKLTLTLETEENVTDMVFYQKMGDGHTSISLARSLGLQDYLDFCYQILIVGGHLINKHKYSLVLTGHLSDILHNLETNMSTSALWAYACAFVCNQKTICKQISGKAPWNKTYYAHNHDKPNLCINLTTIAAMLSSQALLEYALAQLSMDNFEKTILSHTAYDIEQKDAQPGIYYNYSDFTATPLNIAIVSKNIEMINYLLPFVEQFIDYSTQDEDSYETIECYQVQLMAFYIQTKNLTQLQRCLDNGGVKYLTCSISISPKYFGFDHIKSSEYSADDRLFTLLELVMASDWQNGIQLIMTAAAQFKGIRGNNTYISPLFYAYGFRSFEVFKTLIDFGASLTDQYELPTEEENCSSQYLLIPSLFAFTSKYARYIISKIGGDAALQQINHTLMDETAGLNKQQIEILITTREKLLNSTSFLLTDHTDEEDSGEEDTEQGSSALIENSLLSPRNSNNKPTSITQFNLTKNVGQP